MNAKNMFDLAATLDSYEVEELDGHALARLFPGIVATQGRPEKQTAAETTEGVDYAGSAAA